LTVTPDPQNPGQFLSHYIHGGEVSKPVDLTFATNPPTIGFAFNSHHINPNVKFQTAPLNGNTFGPASVSGLPPDHDKTDDTWTATASPFPGGEHEHHEHGHKKH
jgi:hypothetical protein